MVAIRLLSPDRERREWLQSVLNDDPELAVVRTGAELDDLPFQGSLGADVIIVDLNHPSVSESRFWSAIHVYFPGARLMALADEPIVPSTLEASLHAGAYYMVEWTETPQRLRRTAYRAATGSSFIPLGNVIRAMVRYFSAVGLSVQPIRIGEWQLDPIGGYLIRGATKVVLTDLEMDLLLLLIDFAGQTVSVDELIRNVWHQYSGSSRHQSRVKSTVRRLRLKLEPDPKHPRYVLNHRGHGYYVPKGEVD
jgi:DNA-binding winged helix-turn-helix (wHTH) protein